MHPDLPHEQAYFDRALALRDRQQARLAHAPALAANPKAALELRKRVSRFGLTDPDEAVAFGRIDTEDDRWYIGKSAIWDDDNELVVVNWQAPIAAPFYTATPERPEGLVSRRLFRCTGNQIREIEDTVFRTVQQAVEEHRAPEPVVTDALLESLGRSRAGELPRSPRSRRPVRRHRRPLEQLLVVRAARTGKTVVGLHWPRGCSTTTARGRRRSSSANRRSSATSPPTPSLGDEAVVQLPLRANPGDQPNNPPEVRRPKGDRRLLRVIPARATANGSGGARAGHGGPDRRARRPPSPPGPPARPATTRPPDAAPSRRQLALRAAGVDDVEVQGSGPGRRHLPRRVWPRLTPQAFLVELLSSRRQLLAAAAGTLTEDEMAMLALPSGTQVSSFQWSVDDVPLLDAADALLNGVRAPYEHIVVDEAQDLSPMQPSRCTRCRAPAR